MDLNPDLYEYLTGFVDDKTIINMLSVNKKFNDPIFFQRIFKRKYPFLIEFKEDNQTWKVFYLSMIKYIYKLLEEFDLIGFTIKNDLILIFKSEELKIMVKRDFNNFNIIYSTSKKAKLTNFKNTNFIKKSMICAKIYKKPQIIDIVDKNTFKYNTFKYYAQRNRKLQNLQQLQLDCNQIKEIPKEIGQLENLQKLI
ncbi:unnamed protein product [marine sediment metagenome]|uniref:Uncharacterized protein n=1 Tax=marine sediment metagenome TaxID=412755 RepID=X1G4V7_9ZZZZ